MTPPEPGRLERVRRRARIALSLTAVSGLLGAGAPSAAAETQTFLPTGAEQTFTVPANVTSIRIIAVGAQGGAGGGGGTAPGGFGAVAMGDVDVTPGDVLYVNVGGNGAPGDAGGAGGFNGGGSSGEPAGSRGGGGGGASDVRTIPRSAGTSLFSRLVVAGGGGGNGGGGVHAAGGDAGEAGTDAMFSGADGGQPGTQTAGGAGGAAGCSGLSGQLGAGGDSVGGACTGGAPGVGGAGGGGVYGGGAGGTSSDGAGGGGGSSGFAPEVTNTSVQVDTTGLPAVSIIYDESPEPPSPSFGTDTDVTLSLAKKRVARNGLVRVRVANGNDFTVTGALSAVKAARPKGAAALRAVQSEPFDVGANAAETVDLILSKKLRRELRRKKKLRLTVTGAIEDPVGNMREVEELLRLKAKKR